MLTRKKTITNRVPGRSSYYSSQQRQFVHEIVWATYSVTKTIPAIWPRIALIIAIVLFCAAFSQAAEGIR